MCSPERQALEPKERKSQVRFHGRVKFRRLGVPYTNEERESSWYSHQELAAAKEAERKLRMYLSEDPTLCKVNSENMCVLGLRTEQEKLEKNKAVKESIRTVLLAQLEQERKFLKQADDESIFSLDLDDIAKQYALKTQEAAEDALERGLRKAKHLQQLETQREKVASTMQLVSPRTFANAAA